MPTAEHPAAVIRQLLPLLFVQDIERSLRFYRDQLGFRFVKQANDAKGKMFWCMLERGAASIMLQQADEAEDGPPAGRGRGVIFYFLCDDADAMYGELSSHGLRLRPPTIAYYGMKQLTVPEPDGYEICFESEVKPN